MAVDAKQVPITSPCPVELDQSGVRVTDRQLHCGHCTKDVHLLSHMTEAEVRAFMRERDGENLCVSYFVRADGRIKFRDEATSESAVVVPISRLRRAPRTLPAAASLLLAACAAHGGEELLIDGDQIEHVSFEDRTIPQDEPCEPEIAVEGGLKIEPIEEFVAEPGGIVARPIPEPPPEMLKRGGLRRAQIIEREDL